jgi:hypothetical protein
MILFIILHIFTFALEAFYYILVGGFLFTIKLSYINFLILISTFAKSFMKDLFNND